MDTVKLVLYKTVMGRKTDVYWNGKIIDDVLGLDAQPGLKGGYTVELRFFDGTERTLYADAMEIDDTALKQ